MALLILSKAVVSVEDTLRSVALVAYRKGLRLNFDEYRKQGLRTRVNLYIARHYGGEGAEYFYLDLLSEDDVIQEYDVMDLKVNGSQFYRLGVTDQASYDHLMYDFSLEYLRLNPDQCISFYGDAFFFLEDIEKIESAGGYYKDWCYKPL